MTKVIPFKKEHIECMEIRDYEMQTVVNTPNFQTAIQIWEQNRNAGTIIHDGRILAVMGYLELWPGVCEVYVLPSRYLHEYPAAFTRCIKRTLDSGIFNSFHRVQIQAQDDKLHNRWVKFLGFTLEGTFKKYDPLGNDFNMWARVK